MHDSTPRATDRVHALSPAKRQLLERLTGRGSRTHAPAVSPVEQALKAIWSRVLRTDDFGIDDNFFRLGGDSILSIRVRNVVLEELGAAIEIQQIYDRPTIRELAPIVESLKAAGATARSTEQVRADDRPVQSGLPEEVLDAYPMSEMQKAMAFHAELGRSEHTYINHGDALVEGRWSLPAFSAALDALVRRHEILRTRFDFSSYAEPMQLVQRPRRTLLPLVDLTAVAGDARALRKVRTSMLRHPFRLDDHPLMRAVCLKEGDTRHHLEHGHHHSILDGWSLNLLFRELWADYGQALAGVPLGRAPLRTKYRDFVRIERVAVESEESRAYWRTKLQDVPKSRFPVAVSREGALARRSATHEGGPPSRRFGGASEGDSVSVKMPPHVYTALRAMADEEGVHLSTVLLAVHTACVSVLHGQDLATTGRVVNGRPEGPDGDSTLGLFVNTCLHAVDVRGATWRELVRRTAAEERASYPHRRYPIARMQDLLGPGQHFETLFVFENYHMHADSPLSRGLRISGRDHATNDVKLIASFVWSADRTHVDLEIYGLREAVPGWMLHRVAAWYRQACGAMAANPDAAAAFESIFTKPEIHQQAIEWNDTARPLPPRTLPADFEAWAAAAPGAPALFAGERTLTYAELNAAANRLAHILLQTLPDRRAPVAVLLEPGEDQVRAVVAIAKAGFASLPLEVAYPAERVRFALRDAGAGAVLTTSTLAERFDFGGVASLALDQPPISDSRLPSVNSQFPTADRRQPTADSDNPNVAIAGDDPLYVIFTSGSTGTPKAVRLNHRGRASNFHDFIRRFGIGPRDRVLALSNLTFDMSAFDILGTLASGAAIVAPTTEEKKDPHAWLRLIARHCVTVWHSAPALARMLLDAVPAGGGGELGSLRLALLGGDWIPLGLPARLKALVPDIRTISLGGATEVSMDSTIHDITGPEFPIPTVPYGRPMDNQKAFLFGPRLQPTPIGVAGELYLGGVGVGDCYVNRPELTACRFLPNPYATTPGERIYKTGDQARYLCDGTLELLGRRDFQIKINGYRIEPGEIEKTLLAFPGVQKAIVAAKAGADGQRRLVGYLVLDAGRAPDDTALVAEIRRYVSSSLPAYLHPSCYVILDALPLTPNGKVNRLALPDPAVDADATRTVVQPRTDCERTILETWHGVLRNTAIGVEDDFFMNGGDSVSATQIVSRLRVTFGTDIPLALIFDNPTVAQQAQRIEELQASGHRHVSAV